MAEDKKQDFVVTEVDLPPHIKALQVKADALQKTLVENKGKTDTQPRPSAEVVQAAPQIEREKATEPITPVIPPAPQPVEDERIKTLEHKYNVLQGKYNSEIMKLREDLLAASETINGLEHKIQHPTPQEIAKQTKLDFNPEDFDHMGPDFVSFLKTVKNAVEEIQSRPQTGNAQELKEIRESVQSLSGQVRETAKERWERELTQNVPDWMEINPSPDFISWLQEPDPLSGITRQVLANDAANSFNSKRCAAFFKEFKKW